MSEGVREVLAGIATVGLVSPSVWQVRPGCQFLGELRAAPLPAGTRARLLWKPLSARSDWRGVEAAVDGARVEAPLDVDGAVMVAWELTYPDGTALRVPDTRRETPWAVVPR